MNTTVYRVQDANGHGPYVLGTWAGQAALTASHDDRRPPMLPDGNLSAMTSKKALIAWFGPWLPALVEAGFQVVRVTVDADDVSRQGQYRAAEVSYRAGTALRTRVLRFTMARYAMRNPAMPSTSLACPNAVARMERDLGMDEASTEARTEARAEYVSRMAYLDGIRADAMARMAC